MRIVVKIGTSNITYPTGRLNIRHMEVLCKILSDIKNSGCELIVVSSGATAMGVGKLKLSEKPSDMPGKQACAAVGQCELMYTYDKMFTEHSHTVAQILITGDDFKDKTRYENFANTLERLLALKALPIINENDTVSTVEYGVGDNDTLGALVATGVNADLLVLLSDIDGLYTSDPRKDPEAKLIPRVEEITDSIMALGGGKGSALGTGGMATKLGAAKRCMAKGIDMAIINGARPELLYELIEGKAAGTLFVGRK